MRLLSKLCSLTFFLSSTFAAFSQVAIGTGATAPNPDTNAVLLLEGNGSQGIIIPKVSSLGTFGKPGMIVYNTATGTVHYFNTAWVQVGSGAGGTQGIQIVGNKVLIGTGAGFSTEFSIANTAPAVNGQILMWDTSLNAGSGGWTSSGNTAPTIGQVLRWNGSRWEPGTATPALPVGQIFVGNSSNVATATNPSAIALNNLGAPTADVSFGTRKITNLATPTLATDAATKAYVDGITPTVADNSITGGTLGSGVKIAANTITDANINTSANIAGTKINPAFGTQNITTTTGSASIGGGINVGLANGFTINNAGNITKINGATTSFPATNAAGVLTNDGAGTLTWAAAGGAETDPTVRAINGLVKSNGTIISAATAGTDYLTPTGSAAGLTGLLPAQIPSLDASKITTGTLPIANGGTGATTAPLARTALGLGTLATLSSVTTTEITDGTIANVDIANVDAAKITSGTLSTARLDVGTTANQIVQLDATGKLPAVDGSQLTGLAGGGDITGVTAGTGLTGGAASGNATLNVDVGTTANKIVQLDATGKLPAVDGSQLTGLAGGGDITGVTAGTGLTGGAASGNATLNVDVGTTANKIVQLDATGKLPVIDGSQLTNLPAGAETDPTVKAINGLVKSNGTIISAATAGTDYLTPTGSAAGLTGLLPAQIPSLDASKITTGSFTVAQIPSLDASKITTGTLPIANGGTGATTAPLARTALGLGTLATLSSVTTTEITDGTIANVDIANVDAAKITTGTLSTARLDVGTTANQIVQLDPTGKLPAVDGSQLTGLAGGGDITGVTAGTGLTGGAASGNATLNVDVGTTANKIVQLDATGKLPAVDGSQLTGLAGGGSVTNVTGTAPISVATGTSTPVISMTQANTTTNGYLSSTDWNTFNSKQATLSLTTAGTTGPATLVGNTLNVPQYAGATYAAGTGLTLAVNTFSVNASQNISTLSNLTTNGLIKTSGGTGALSIATAGTDYLTPTGSAAGLTGLLPAQIPSLDASKITTGTLPIANGGTGATTAPLARTALGLGTLATLSSVTTTEITDGTIVDADVSGTAAIAGSKVNPSFGAQNVLTTGTLTTGTAGAFSVDASGNITKIRNVTTSFPAANAAGVLTNDGTGTLTWAAGSSGWGLTGNAGTNPATNFIGTTDAQPLRFATGVGGTERMRLDATGKLGFGITAPLSKFHIKQSAQVNDVLTDIGSGFFGAGLMFENAGTTDAYYMGYSFGGYFQIGQKSLSNVFTGMVYASPTGVGIFNPVPTEKLDVTGNVKFSGALMPNNLPGTAGQVLTSAGPGLPPTWSPGGSGWALGGNSGLTDGAIGVGNNYIGTTDNKPLNFRVFNSRAGRLDPALPTATFFGISSGQNNTGVSNTGLGYFALAQNTTGAGNTAVGTSSLANSTGNDNTAVGNGALFNHLTGNGNSAFGQAALSNSINASGNTAMGNVSLWFTTGQNNTALGGSSGVTNTTGNNNTFLGYGGDATSNNLTNATAIGYNAKVGANNTIQLGDAAVTAVNVGTGTTAKLIAGQLQVTGGTLGAGRVLTSDAIGNATWQASASGWALGGNTGTVDGAIGTGTNYIGTRDNVPLNLVVNNQRAGRIEAASASANSFMGYQAGNVNTGTFNAAVGYWAMTVNTTGQGNAAVGYRALANNTTGNSNASVGFSSLAANTTGYSNTAIGSSALLNVVIGYENTAVGQQALLNATGNANVGIGSQAATLLTTGIENAALGTGALFNTTTGSFNTAVGNASLSNNITGSANTAIGYDAEVATGALSNATAIGANASVTTSNTIQLGNSGVTTVNVGTGTTAKLVAGQLQITGGTLGAGRVLTSDASGNATWQAAGGGFSTNNVVPRGNGTTLVSSAIQDDGTNTGVGVAPSATNKLTVTNSTSGILQGIYATNSQVGAGSSTAVRGDASGSTNTNFGLYGTATGGTLGATGVRGTATGATTNYGIYGDASGGTTNYAGYFAGNTAITGALLVGGTPSAGTNGQVLTSAGAGVPPTWNTPSGSTLINNTGTRNLFAGLGLPTTGTDNAFFGDLAGISNTTGSYNVIMGTQAAQLKTTGDLNVIIGWRAGRASTTHQGNTLVGANAGEFVTAGTLNSFFGERSGYKTTTGNGNTFIGDRAGAVFPDVGTFGNTTGSDNTAFGAFATMEFGNLSNATAVGMRAMVSNSNSLVLGSINGVNGATASTNVGVGTTAPAQRFHISDPGANQVYMRITNSASANGINIGLGGAGVQEAFIANNENTNMYFQTNATNRMTISNAGNVGIGTIFPSYRLTLNEASQPLMNFQTPTTGGLTSDGFMMGINSAAGSGVIWNWENQPISIATNNLERMRIDGAGNVGIGTTTPNGFTGKLVHLSGTGNTAYILEKTDATARKWGMVTGGGGEYIVQDMTGSSNAFTMQAGVVTNQLYLQAGGNVGIGTNTPGVRLDIVGTNAIFLSGGPNVFFNSFQGGSLSTGLNPTPTVAVRASGAFLSVGDGTNAGFYVTSDERIKRKVGVSDSKKDLLNLMKLKITDYTFVDSLNAGNVSVKGVFAQEVEKVYPQAVSRQTSFIPNIYAMASDIFFDEANKTLRVSLAKQHDLKVGDKVKLISNASGEKPSLVTAINGNSFTVADWTEKSEKIFVYGKEVNDFRIVDYDRLFTLNLSATQELVKMVEEQKKVIDELKAKEEESKKKIAVLEASLNKVAAGETELGNLKSEIEKIKAALGLSVEATVKKTEEKTEVRKEK